MWWMPWRSQAMKDVVACEKSRGASKRALIREYPNGETRPLHHLLLGRALCERNASTKVSRTKRAWRFSLERALCERNASTKGLPHQTSVQGRVRWQRADDVGVTLV